MGVCPSSGLWVRLKLRLTFACEMPAGCQLGRQTPVWCSLRAGRVCALSFCLTCPVVPAVSSGGSGGRMGRGFQVGTHPQESRVLRGWLPGHPSAAPVLLGLGWAE